MRDLSQLVAIRKKRADRKMRLEAKARQALLAASSDVQKALDDIEAFAQQVKTLELDLLNDLLKCEVTVADIKKMESQLLAAEKQAAKLREQLTLAQEKEDAHENAFQKARSAKVDAHSSLQKIEVSQEHLLSEVAKLESEAEDRELDEVVQGLFRREAGGHDRAS
ncbi:hypothetical protein [uncultured Tateyamaria sp.]|uniref:hypothetical protein n=1 Tax=uncultured Tateyamaria sp. TaxID=455651 RepID=UPI0026285E3D|nr:hypothetical protein [uncultured Tateyamaria sp.]